MKEYIKNKTEEISSSIIELRRQLHAIPELAFCEHKTAAVIEKKLAELGIHYDSKIAKTGVVGIIEGGGEKTGKTLLIRADMDALPITEENDVAYKSVNEGFMHACGHDAHVAILLGVAEVLNGIADQLCGNVKLVFQPGEEAAGGAEPMIAEGVMKNPDVTAAIACHMWPDVSVGSVQVKYGAMMASPDDFYLTIHGRGGHGAKPEKAINPIDIGCVLVNQLQSLPARRLGAVTPALVTVCQFASGTCTNVIPDTAQIKGTFRTFDPIVRKKLGEYIEETVKTVVESMGGGYELVMKYLYPPLVNDNKMVDLIVQSADCLNVEWLGDPSMGGEDFSFFAELVPSAMCLIGTKNEGDSKTHYPIHHPRFDIDEAAIKNAIYLIANTCVNYLNE